MTEAQKTLRFLNLAGNEIAYYSLPAWVEKNKIDLPRLPFSIRILLEMLLRQEAEGKGNENDLESLAAWKPVEKARASISIHPQRVVMQDLTGVPVLNDLASLRAAVSRAGGNPAAVNPVIPVDLVVDHSIQVDYTGIPDAYKKNLELEFKRNRERYQFLKWAQKAFQKFRLIPPATGIVHQVNLESLSPVVWIQDSDGMQLAAPDMVIGTDSHTPMINGLGVLGWGVGGIEAIAAMLGNPLELMIPDVVGVRLFGSLPAGTTPSDLTLTIVQKLRALGVVDKFIEFTGPALETLGVPERAMIANMAPEYGATASYFPIDLLTLNYLRLTGRPDSTVQLVEAFFREQGLFRSVESPEPEFSTLLELDLSEIVPSIAGPKKPQSRVSLTEASQDFQRLLKIEVADGGYGLSGEQVEATAEVRIGGNPVTLKHGSVVLAAITSCTNTSDPFVMIAAGLLARNALARGMRIHPAVKASLSPGSRVVSDYLAKAGLLDKLEGLGFTLAGYGCMTCIGNSGQLDLQVADGIEESKLVAAAVISGNRNFEGRVQPLVRANYLASPPLVVAYALAGSMDIDLTRAPLGMDAAGEAVTLAEIWPGDKEIREVIAKYVKGEVFQRNGLQQSPGSSEWQELEGGDGLVYAWDQGSNYLKEPPFATIQNVDWSQGVREARALVVFGDGITTDHISPAGAIHPSSPAGRYLQSRGVSPADFNSYGSRRGNDEVMVRGTFANTRLKNKLIPGAEGGRTLHLPSETQMDIFDAAMRYKDEHIPLVILAGREYGTGSSRDWAAKGVLLLGVRAVIAESFERIHRSNLAGMGVLPLQFLEGEGVQKLGLTGKESFTISAVTTLEPGAIISVIAEGETGDRIQFQTRLRVDTLLEMETLLQGGILMKAYTQTIIQVLN
jgi:aconitate hydratase